MAKELALFDSAKKNLPAHIQSAFGEESNIAERQTVPSLTYGGKTWAVVRDGEKSKLMRMVEGEEQPVSVLSVVVLDYAKRRGRAFYEGNYDPDNPQSPVCWSEDGLKPDDRVPEDDRQCDKCETCPMAAKGSKVLDGKKMVACSQFRMLAVAPAAQLMDGKEITPLRLKLAITSDYDKSGTHHNDKGWYAFQQFLDLLRKNRVPHSAAVVTKMKFDPDTDYPKVLFKPDRFLEEDEIAKVAPVVKSDEVAGLIKGTWTVNGVDGTKHEDDEDEEVPPKKMTRAAPPPVGDEDEDEVVEPAPKKAPAKKAPAKKSAPVEDDEDEDEVVEPAPKKGAKAAAPKKAPPPSDDEDDDDGQEVIPPKKAAKGAKSEVPDDVASLLDEWE